MNNLIFFYQKKSYSQSQRSFAIGTILECLSSMDSYVAEYVSELLPLFMKNASDQSDEIRSNCYFGIGELALYGKEAVYPYPYLYIFFHLRC